jgi:hypothetical protein
MAHHDDKEAEQTMRLLLLQYPFIAPPFPFLRFSPRVPLPSPLLPCSDLVALHYDLILQCTFFFSSRGPLFICVCHVSANVPLDWKTTGSIGIGFGISIWGRDPAEKSFQRFNV